MRITTTKVVTIGQFGFYPLTFTPLKFRAKAPNRYLKLTLNFSPPHIRVLDLKIELKRLFACWFQPTQTSQPTVFSSHKKPAPAPTSEHAHGVLNIDEIKN